MKVMGFLVLLLSLNSLAQEVSPAFCRKACQEYLGWCLPFGPESQAVGLPYLQILKAAENGGGEFAQDSCKKTVRVKDNQVGISGAACSVVQEDPQVLVHIESHFPEVIHGLLGSTDGKTELIFSKGFPRFGFKLSELESAGPVPFVTVDGDETGITKVLWSDGVLCYSSVVDNGGI